MTRTIISIDFFLNTENDNGSLLSVGHILVQELSVLFQYILAKKHLP